MRARRAAGPPGSRAADGIRRLLGALGRFGPLPSLNFLHALARGAAGAAGWLGVGPIERRSAAVRRNVARVYAARPCAFRRSFVEVERRHALAKIVEEMALLAMPAAPFVAYIRDRTRVAGFGHLERALERGPGAILSTCHLGPIAYVPAILLEHGGPLIRGRLFLYANKRVPGALGELIAARIAEAARHYGARVEEVPVEDRFLSARTMLRGLERGGVVYLAADGDLFGPGRRTSRHRISLFGHSLRVGGGAAYLALRSGAPLLPAYCIRGRRDRMTFHILPPLEVAPDASAEALTQRLFAVHRGWLERHAEQWLFWDRLERIAVPEGAGGP